MKAPNKIYLNIHPDWTDGEYKSEVTWSEAEDPFYDNIPYIRKDALLKKIRKIAIWNTIKVGRKEIRDIVTAIINSL